MTFTRRWASTLAGLGMVWIGLGGHANVSHAHPPDLVLQLDMTACHPRCMPRAVVRSPAAPMRERVVWVDNSQSADARIVLKPQSIEWWVGTELRPRFTLTSDPRWHSADGGLREQWETALTRVFLARSLLYAAFARPQSTVKVSVHRRGPTEMGLILHNTGARTQGMEVFFVDRAYGLQRRSLSPMEEDEARELAWSVGDTTDPAQVVLRVQRDGESQFSATRLQANAGEPEVGNWSWPAKP